MAEPVYLTAPERTSGMPRGIPFIVGNEAAERFTFYGLRAVLVVYMTQYLRSRSGALAVMNENSANQWYHWFVASNYLVPTLGAIIADAWWGKYQTILVLSVIYCLGCLLLASDVTRLGLFGGLGLIALGAGGIKPCVSSHVGDQFGSQNQHLLARAFGWFYFAVNAGSTLSILLVPWLLEHWGAGWAFGIPAALMLVATGVFWSGRFRFAHIPPGGKAFLAATLSRSGWQVIGRISIIYAFVAVFWSLWDQSGGEWVLQAQKMDLHFLGVHWLASQIQAVNAVMILAFIPLFQYGVYPAVSRVFPLTPLRKIGLGLVVTGLSFLVSALIETKIQAGEHPNIAWQLPAYVMLSAGEILVSITSLEFAYTQAPKAMKSIIMSLYLLAISAGNAFTALVHWFISNPDGSVKLSGPAYYRFFALLSIGCVTIYVFVAKAYRERTYLPDEPTAAEALAESTD